MRVIKQGSYSKVELESIERLPNGYLAVFKSDEKYVGGVFDSNGYKLIDGLYQPAPCIYFNLGQEDSCDFTFVDIDCDLILIQSYKFQYCVYFFEGLYDAGVDIPFELETDNDR